MESTDFMQHYNSYAADVTKELSVENLSNEELIAYHKGKTENYEKQIEILRIKAQVHSHLIMQLGQTVKIRQKELDVHYVPKPEMWTAKPKTVKELRKMDVDEI